MWHEVFNDYELIYLCKEHNEKALKVLVKKYEEITSIYIKTFSRDLIDIEFLLSEGIRLLYYCIQNFDNITPLYPFFKGCLRNTLYTYFKRKRITTVIFENYNMFDNYSNSFNEDVAVCPPIRFTTKLQKTIIDGIASGKKPKVIAEDLNIDARKIYYELIKLRKMNNKKIKK